MLFQSQEFILLLLPCALLSYYALAQRPNARKGTLVLVSLLFYGWWDWRFLPLFLGHIVIAWAGPQLALATARPVWINLAIALQLLSLGFWKYTNFLVETVGKLAGLAIPAFNIVLPIGISFFTFQLVSYLIDVRRGEAAPYRLRSLLLYIGFFPHLIAGPMVRHNELLPQFALDPRRPGLAKDLGIGFILFFLGALKKVYLADRLGVLADSVFGDAGIGTGFVSGWMGAIAFSFQLFFDFSAYTEMAIGLALMFRLRLPENFRAPYRATDLREFWRRWHITLSTFLRDYVYIPLGGSRGGTALFIVSTMVTMALCGLWHGAGWSFVLWGLYHGVGLLVVNGWKGLNQQLPVPLAWLATFVFVVIGWVLFRSGSLDTARQMFAAMAGVHGFGANSGGTKLIALAAIVAIVCPPSLELADRWIRPWSILAVVGALAAVIVVIRVGEAPPAPFIYFQF